MKHLNICMERYHDFCEYYMYRALSEHTFYVADNNFPPKRQFPPNVIITPWAEMPWDKIDLGYAVSVERVNALREHNKPFVFHIDQVPQQWDNPSWLNGFLHNAPTLYWSEEEADMWAAGTRIVRPHPIDTTIFNGYNPTKKSALTIASRAISGWGPELKGYYILKDAYQQLPIQVIAKDDFDFPNAFSTTSEEDMIRVLRDHQLYFNCAWKLDRSPLEAMAVGMPVIAIKTKYNVYTGYFQEAYENIIYANTPRDMIEKAKWLLESKEMCYEIGANARRTIEKYWSVGLAREGWNDAFARALG